jgi:hypothetical protein
MLVFIYVEFCPSWIYHGWWFYLAPVVDGKPDRKQYVWLNKSPWMLDLVMDALGLPALHEYRYGLAEPVIDAFMEHYPSGAILACDKPMRRFEAAPKNSGVETWRCLKVVRESQLKDFVEQGGKEET